MRERVAPRAAEIDAKAEYPWDLRKLFAEQDLLGLPFEEEYGGTGTGTLMLNIAVEEVAKACASTALILMVQELGTLPIRLFGSDELKQRFLPRCASGEWSPAFALSEPEAGSDPGGMITTARPRRRRVGHQRHEELDHQPRRRRLLRRLRGHGPREPAHLRLRRRGRPARLQRRQARAQARHQGLADRPADLRRRPRPAREPDRRGGQGPLVALGTLDHSRLGVAAQAVGIAQGATDYAAAYARERSQFGQPINEFQGIQFKLADMETRTAAARELLYKACAKIDRHEPDRGKYSAMAKLFASDTAMAVTVEAVQVLGGYGYVSEYPVERYMRDAKITQIYEGTNEIQRLVIARTHEVMLSDWPAWRARSRPRRCSACASPCSSSRSSAASPPTIRCGSSRALAVGRRRRSGCSAW